MARSMYNDMMVDCVSYRNAKGNRGGAHLEFVQLMKMKAAHWADNVMDLIDCGRRETNAWWSSWPRSESGPEPLMYS